MLSRAEPIQRFCVFVAECLAPYLRLVGACVSILMGSGLNIRPRSSNRYRFQIWKSFGRSTPPFICQSSSSRRAPVSCSVHVTVLKIPQYVQITCTQFRWNGKLWSIARRNVVLSWHGQSNSGDRLFSMPCPFLPPIRSTVTALVNLKPGTCVVIPVLAAGCDLVFSCVVRFRALMMMQ